MKDKLLSQPNWKKWDVRSRLRKDPHRGGVGHNENGVHHITQVQVIGQDGFPELIEEMTEWGQDHFLKNGPGGFLYDLGV